MALKKEIELENGIKLNYHRIVSIHKITNGLNVIEVGSYINEEKRAEEKEAIKEGKGFNVYINTQFLTKEYNEEETIEDEYEYLKTLDIFKNAENI